MAMAVGVAVFQNCNRRTNISQVRSTPSPILNPSPQDNSYGKRLYREKGCEVCHGENGNGYAGIAQSFKERAFTFDEFKMVLNKGVKKMPAYQGIIRQTDICYLYVYIVEDIQRRKGNVECPPRKEIPFD